MSWRAGKSSFDLLGAALVCLNDGCPSEPEMQLCRMQEDDDGQCCHICWERYLFWVYNGRSVDAYRYEKACEVV